MNIQRYTRLLVPINFNDKTVSLRSQNIGKYLSKKVCIRWFRTMQQKS